MTMISDKRFRALIENSSDAIALFSTDATFLYASPSTERLLGYSPDELIGKSGFDVVHPDDAQRAAQLLSAAIESPGRTVRDELRCRHRDGSWRWIDLLGHNLLSDPDVQAIVANYRDITEQKEAQELARRDAARLRILTDALPVLISYIGSDLRYRFHNRQYQLWFGDSAEAMDGKYVWEVLGEPAFQAIRSYLEAALAGDKVSYEGWVPYAVKGTRFIHATYVPDIDPDGRVNGLFTLVIDATDQKVTDQHLRQALDAARMVAWSLDPHSNAVVQSPKASEIMGLPSGRTTVGFDENLQRIHPDDRARHQAALAEARAGKGTYVSQFRYVRPDNGEVIWLEDVGRMMFGADRSVEQIAGVARDITAQKRAEEAAVESERRLGLALEAAQMGTWFWNLATDEINWNAQHEILLGYPPGQPNRTYRDFIDRVHPEDRESLEAAVRVATEGSGSFNCEYRVVWPDGSIHWMAGRGQVYNGAHHMHGVVYDITARKDLEQTLKEIARRKDEFLAMLGHELRNPLAPLRSASEVLRLVENDDPRLQRVSAILERQTTHLRRLVDDLLDVARVTQGKISLQLKVLDLNEVVRQAADTVRTAVEEQGLELRLSLPARPLYVRADSVRLVQVFANLLSNAAKFTPAGGHVVVRVEKQGETAKVEVSDTGVGIPPDMLGQIFELFVQQHTPIDRQHAGLGVGLTLVRGLVESHGGIVTARSPGVGQGSVFTVSLPVAPQISAPQPSSPRADVMQRRILLVEDNADGAAALAMLLEMQGHQVRVAADGLEALAAAAEFQPEVALVDIGLPGIDGYEVARRLRGDPSHAGCRLIALSGYGQGEDKERARNAGFDQHLTKPVEPSEINAALSR